MKRASESERKGGLSQEVRGLVRTKGEEGEKAHIQATVGMESTRLMEFD